MNKYKFTLLKLLDRFIRFMGLVGGAIIAILGVILNWWDNYTGSLIYLVIFVFSMIYCMEYNGEEWAV